MTTPGDILMLRDGAEVEYVGMDEDSGWPIVRLLDTTILAINPVVIQEGWNDDLDDQ